MSFENDFYDVLGYEDYLQINRLGKIFIKRKNYETFGTRTQAGYLQVGIRTKDWYKNFLIHRLIAIQFIENPNNKITVNHIDTNKENNFYKNLEWATYQENMNHVVQHGLTWKGEDCLKSKLNIKQVENLLLDYYKNGIKPLQIQNTYGISEATMYSILNGETWKDVYFSIFGNEKPKRLYLNQFR